MKTGQGYLVEWTVVNAAEDNGDDRRRIVAKFVVPARSPISMSVAALSGQPARLTAALPLSAENMIDSIPCTISPPWGAKKRGGFGFKAVMDYSEDLVRSLTTITHGLAMTVGLEVVQTEIDTDPEHQAVLEFVRGGDGIE